MSQIDRSTEWFGKCAYRAIRFLSRLLFVWLFDFRCHGRQHIVKGPALILSTHQSNFDPVLVGLVFPDPISGLARSTLFVNPLLAWIIRLLNAIELDRDRSGIAGLKATLQQLKYGQKVLIFPEGTRSPDGSLQPIKSGFLVVAKRTRVPLIPVAIAGAFEALPRGSLWPKRHPIHMAIGPAIPYAEYGQLSETEAVQLITRRLSDYYSQAGWSLRG
ncbi:MAG: 1-acyl-sn-glycerol-3-phosphate acyltransferase [Pirellulaceae bacterium]|nr:1-acyl-sn-glycerol-3-phosphate acyltransferase [Pirellulaceae bacterium]